jgi:CRP-like cAMP-binding protein
MKKTFQWKEFLRTHPIFGTLRDDKRIDALLKDDVSWERTYAKDDVIVRQREVGISVFLIGSGTAEATLELSEGPPISLSVMRKGDLFGEMALLDHEQRSATVKATQPCTILEFDGREFEQLMVEYPEIASRLLLTISRRLRNTGEQILGLQLTNVDDKLKYFNLKLDTEQKLVETQIRAAQQMFDHTKLRTDEVITSAERSRDRLNKVVGLVSALATVGLLIAGAFGYKQVLDVNQFKEDMKVTKAQADANAKASAESAKVAADAAARIEEDAKNVVKKLSAVDDFKGPFVDIIRGRFMDNVREGRMADAKRDYGTLISLGGTDELETVVSWLAPRLLGNPKRDEIILALLDDFDTDSKRTTDKSTRVKVFCLRIGYSILTDPNRPARDGLYADLTQYIKENPTAKLRTSLISEEVQRQNPDKAAELKTLRDLTTRS